MNEQVHRRPELSRVVHNRSVGPDWYVLRLHEARIAEAARPGQFVQVRCADGASTDPFLRRPFSVYCTDPRAGTYEILYTTVGRGTRWMSTLAGCESNPTPSWADVEGPFGNAFSLPESSDEVLLVGGGVGVAPLYFLALEVLGAARRSGAPPPPRMTLLVGARTRSLLQGIDDARRLDLSVQVATDDGTEGYRGFVTGLLEDVLARAEHPERLRVYGCGPQGMLEALRGIVVARGIRSELSLESLMACGFGICFGCVAPVRRTPDGEVYNRRVCCEGTVFDARLLAQAPRP